MKYVDYYYDIVPRDLKHVAPPSSLYHLPPDLGELFESSPWAVNSLENILFRTNAPSSDILWHVHRLDLLIEFMSLMRVI